MGAGYLIKDAYSDWLSSPYSTTITTHPIDDLDFPTVTVCPPKGSHSALNYDVMKADKNSLLKKDRKNLKTEINKIFIEAPHQEYIRTMVAVANPENMKQIFEGFQSVPRSDPGDRGFEVRMWSNNGSWHTPWFGEEHETNYYKKDKYYNLLIEMPKDLKVQIGLGSLVIQVDRLVGR